jgi:UDP-N-acetyl-D-glucosamine dehydrogenase
MVDVTIRNPKILILGVAYKPGIGDVRETPVSELRDYLEAQGVEIAWHDPLVSTWNGTKSVDLDWNCDLAILATNQPGMDLKQLFDRRIPILDCTNSITNQAGVSFL